MWLVVIKFLVLTFSQKAKKKQELKILTEAITERDAKYTPPYL